jgi:hypothetical protein
MAQLWFLEIRVGFKATALVWAPYDYIVATLLFISGNDFLAAWLLVNSCRVQILLFFPFAGVYFFFNVQIHPFHLLWALPFRWADG